METNSRIHASVNSPKGSGCGTFNILLIRWRWSLPTVAEWSSAQWGQLTNTLHYYNSGEEMNSARSVSPERSPVSAECLMVLMLVHRADSTLPFWRGYANALPPPHLVIHTQAWREEASKLLLFINTFSFFIGKHGGLRWVIWHAAD